MQRNRQGCQKGAEVQSVKKRQLNIQWGLILRGALTVYPVSLACIYLYRGGSVYKLPLTRGIVQSVYGLAGMGG